MNLRQHTKPKLKRNIEAIWKDIKKNKIYLYDMANSHIINSIKMLKRKIIIFGDAYDSNEQEEYRTNVVEPMSTMIKEFEHELAYRKQNDIYIDKTILK